MPSSVACSFSFRCLFLFIIMNISHLYFFNTGNCLLSDILVGFNILTYLPSPAVPTRTIPMDPSLNMYYIHLLVLCLHIHVISSIQLLVLLTFISSRFMSLRINKNKYHNPHNCYDTFFSTNLKIDFKRMMAYDRHIWTL